MASRSAREAGVGSGTQAPDQTLRCLCSGSHSRLRAGRRPAPPSARRPSAGAHSAFSHEDSVNSVASMLITGGPVRRLRDERAGAHRFLVFVLVLPPVLVVSSAGQAWAPCPWTRDTKGHHVIENDSARDAPGGARARGGRAHRREVSRRCARRQGVRNRRPLREALRHDPLRRRSAQRCQSDHHGHRQSAEESPPVRWNSPPISTC